MMAMTVVSSAAAEKRNSPEAARNHARPKAYVALLRANARGVVTRDFVKRDKSGTAAQLLFHVQNQPGDIYEIRRWFWDGDRSCFMGGIVYIAFDEANRPVLLTREEAFLSIQAIALTSAATASTEVDIVRPARMLPVDIRIS